MESKVKKSYYIWKWIITGIIIFAVFAAGCLSGAVMSENRQSSVVYMHTFDTYLTKLLKKCDVNLPETAEFVMGFKTTHSIDRAIYVFFTIDESELGSMLGDNWKSPQDLNYTCEDLERTDILIDNFGWCPYKEVINNRQWQFDKEKRNSSHSYTWVYTSKPIDDKIAVVFIYWS